MGPPSDLVVFSLGQLREKATAFATNRELNTPIVTPWGPLNERLQGGFWPGFYVLVSGTGAGKTQFALACALEAAASAEKIATHYISLELGPEEIYARLVALAMRREGHRVAWSKLLRDRDSIAHLTKHGTALDDLPLTVEVARPHGWSADRLLALSAERKPRLIVVDFLQLVSSQGEDPRTAMTRVAYAARTVAREHHCVVLALSSTARANYAAAAGDTKSKDPGPGKGPPARFVGLGKDAGEIEYAADGVLALVDEGHEARGQKCVHIAIAKLRGGPAAWVPPLHFDGCSFEEASDEDRDKPTSPGRRTPSSKNRVPAPVVPAPIDPPSVREGKGPVLPTAPEEEQSLKNYSVRSGTVDGATQGRKTLPPDPPMSDSKLHWRKRR